MVFPGHFYCPFDRCEEILFIAQEYFLMHMPFLNIWAFATFTARNIVNKTGMFANIPAKQTKALSQTFLYWKLRLL